MFISMSRSPLTASTSSLGAGIGAYTEASYVYYQDAVDDGVSASIIRLGGLLYERTASLDAPGPDGVIRLGWSRPGTSDPPVFTRGYPVIYGDVYVSPEALLPIDPNTARLTNITETAITAPASYADMEQYWNTTLAQGKYGVSARKPTRTIKIYSGEQTQVQALSGEYVIKLSGGYKCSASGTYRFRCTTRSGWSAALKIANHSGFVNDAGTNIDFTPKVEFKAREGEILPIVFYARNTNGNTTGTDPIISLKVWRPDSTNWDDVQIEELCLS